jgi:DNA sulfur modification protein DndC
MDMNATNPSASCESLSDQVFAALESLYYSDSRPWVIAYSGGKDSTLVLQLVYEFLLKGKDMGKAEKPIFVISSDTRVEAPNVSRYVVETLDRIRKAAEEHQIRLNTRLVSPSPEQSFWGKLIGLGYPPPTRWFRWCTTSMKIKPSRQAIGEIVRDFGSVILLLGTRSDESAARRNAIAGRDTNTRGLNPHHEIPNALVATPIVDWSNDDVWEYLYTNDPPWGGDHSFMLSLYRQANGGECPVVLDLNTPSCGGSRFGCWTCTVVKEDKSMQGFIQTGETWMQPLAEFRDWLKEIREDPRRRNPLRRDEKTAGPGPFNAATRKEILEGLLAMAQRIGFELISDGDLKFIQREWTKEFDYEQTVYKLARTYGREIVVEEEKLVLSPEDELLEHCALNEGFPLELARQLFEIVRSRHADLDRLGAKTELQRELKSLIEKDVNQALSADPAHDL